MTSSEDNAESNDTYTDYYYDYEDEFANTCHTFLEMTRKNLFLYLAFILGILLHLFLIYRLLTRVAKKRAYHYFVIAQSVVDCVYLSYGPLIFNTGCFVFHIIIDDYITPVLKSVQLILCVFLTIYWKSAIHPQRWWDRSLFGIALVSILGVVIFDIFQTVTVAESQLNVYIKLYPLYLAAVIFLTATCAASYVFMMRMDVSKFSDVTLKGQKKLASILFYQLVCMQTCHVLDSVMNIYNIYQLYVLDTEGFDSVVVFLDKYDGAASVLQEISTIWAIILPVIRGILICWAIKPLLQTKAVTVITRSTTSTTQRS